MPNSNTTQIEEGLHYRVIHNADASLKLDRSKEVHIGAIVKALECAPYGSLDVIDVEIDGYEEPTVFAYQLDDTPIKPDIDLDLKEILRVEEVRNKSMYSIDGYLKELDWTIGLLKGHVERVKAWKAGGASERVNYGKLDEFLNGFREG